MLSDFTAWLLGLVVQILVALGSLFSDVFIAAAGAILQVIAALFAAIPVPDFMQGGLSSLFSGLDPGVLFYLSAFGIPQVLSMVGAAFAFRIARKVVTLFQW